MGKGTMGWWMDVAVVGLLFQPAAAAEGPLAGQILILTLSLHSESDTQIAKYTELPGN